MLTFSIVGGRISLQMLLDVHRCSRIDKTFLGLKILWLARAVRVRVPPSASKSKNLRQNSSSTFQGRIRFVTVSWS